MATVVDFWRSLCNWMLRVTWETRWTLAKAYYHQQQYGDALKMTPQALAASNGKAPEIELLLAQSLTAAGNYEEAAH